ncbi:hypothetical protein KQI42_15800 [Tissierella sp. MSJ-40]|uniref:Uncharacterized protein n=1 Tax=Tissierella simiarum TaxID=2841534 RepID=A0ABS6EBA7_9FIRM|nr:hypothetical protein [Tissierella simiarum]MBU5439479.1 hypothetical protein [Tissierella simiarum]
MKLMLIGYWRQLEKNVLGMKKKINKIFYPIMNKKELVEMLDEISINVAEAIPYKSFKEMTNIVEKELNKNRYIEIWDKYIYSAENWRENDKAV